MNTIKIAEDFIINGKKVKLLSGAVHYFRIVPEYWEDSLLDLKDMGLNCVETYVPWNFHEMKKGEFDFSGIKDLESFIRLVKKHDLYLILRPSPYICSEWDFGGLPAWLLKEDIRLRTDDKVYLDYVDDYYKVLIPKLSKYQWTKGGPVILFQLENEYGSYRNNKSYLKKLHAMLKKYGVEVPIFTSDGCWQEALEAGNLLEEGVFPTGNFGSEVEKNVEELKKFNKKHGIKSPIMSMEFWDGWFSSWGRDLIRRDPEDLARDVQKMIELGSFNLYMFHGGTNFGFFSGCNAEDDEDIPQITSYDYDAILTEEGRKTEKYRLLRKIIRGKEDKLLDRRTYVKYGDLKLKRKASLFNNLDTIATKKSSRDTMSFEELDHYYGYVLYKHHFKSQEKNLRMRLVGARDRANIYLNDRFISSKYKKDLAKEFIVGVEETDNDLKILVENMGRVNYGHKLEATSQKKGINQGVMVDLHFVEGWDHYLIDFDRYKNINWDGKEDEGPGFYEYILDTDDPKDSFIDLSSFGKGIVLVNGFNLGRFYNVGPSLSLYLPGALLKKGENQIIVFETEGKYSEVLGFSEKPIYK